MLEVGNWLSKDPIGISGGLNQYLFCGNNPVNARDPNGEKIVSGVEAQYALTVPGDNGSLSIGGVSHVSDWSGGGFHDYVYHSTGTQIAADLGGSLVSVWAVGRDNAQWTGDFKNVVVNAGIFSGSVFWGDGWFGVTFGFAVGMPGGGLETTRYHDANDWGGCGK